MVLQENNHIKEGRKKGNILLNDALNTFYFYGYMASDIW